MANNNVVSGIRVSRRRVMQAGAALGFTLVGLAGGRSRAMNSAALSGPLPDTPGKGVLVWDVAGLDYIAEEYFLTGNANVYQPVSMADAPDVASRDNVKDLSAREFTREVLQADQPFTTRLVVYRPRNPRRFSGTVIVETLHPIGGGTSVAWRALNAFFAARGDLYVGVQHPLTFAGLQAADPVRYGPLTAKSPTQLWGMLSQAGALFKGARTEGILRDYAVRRLVMTGYSYTGVATSTFANYHHAAAKIDGHNIFDAYLPMANAQYIRPLDVPVIRLNTQSDFNSFGGLNNRRPDDDLYRHYEIAGASHVAVPPPPGAAIAPTAGKVPTPAGQPHFSEADCRANFPQGSRPNDYPLDLVQAALFDTMHQWIASRRAPPPSLLIETNPDGSALVDSWGNAVGGVRYPQVTVPIAHYGVGPPGPCLLFGYTAPFTEKVCRSLYGEHANYVAKVRAASEALVKDRMLLRPGVERLVSAATADHTF